MHLAFCSCFKSIYITCLSPLVFKNSKAYYTKSKANEFTYIHQNIFLQSEEHQKSLLNLQNIYHTKLSDQLIIMNKASVYGTHTFQSQLNNLSARDLKRTNFPFQNDEPPNKKFTIRANVKR